MENELLKNIKTFKTSAELVYSNKDYTSATILYFKLAFVVLDYIIYQKNKSIPKDHTERFRILQKQFFEEYQFLDKFFELYRTTYSLSVEKEKCDLVKENVNRIMQKYRIPF